MKDNPIDSDSSSLIFKHGYALFIGINYYHWKRGRLNGTTRDTDDLYNHFTDPQKAAYNPDNVIVLKEENATKKNILSSLDTLIQKADSDKEATILVYFSGHGAVQGKHSFLLPYDFKLAMYDKGAAVEDICAITSTEFGNKINAINAKKCLIILDCCHAEGMTDIKSIEHLFLDNFTEDLNTIIENTDIDKSVANTVKSGRGKVVLTSCAENEKSLDLGSNGLFTQVLLECLSGQDNIEKDGWVRLYDMMRYVPKTVKKRALQKGNYQQNPVFKSIKNLSSEDFILCAYDIVQAKGLRKTNKSETVQTQQSELENLINQGDTVEVFKRLDRVSSLKSNPQYYRFKREYAAGLKGIDLMDFSDRLKVFINSNI